MDKLFGKGGWLIPDFRRVAKAATLAVALQNAIVPPVAWAAGPFTENVSGASVVNDEVVSAGGGSQGGDVQTVISGGSAVDGTVVSGGSQLIRNLGSALRMLISSGGSQIVSSGGRDVSATVGSGGEQHVSSGGHASGATVSGGTQYVHSGGYASGTLVSGSGGLQYVSDYNGVARDTTLRAGGQQDIHEGGSAYDTVISSGGQQNVFYSGSAYDTVIHDGGQQNVFYWGSAYDTIISSGGNQRVSNGGLADGVIVHDGGQQDVYGGGADFTVIHDGGRQYVSGGYVWVTTIHGGGQQDVSVGIADGTIISGGQQNVYSSGHAFFTTIHDGGRQDVFGGHAENTIIHDGGRQNVDGGWAIVTIIHDGGEQHVSGSVSGSSGRASYTYISNGGSQVISAGGRTFVANLNSDPDDKNFLSEDNYSGYQHVSSGGLADYTNIGNGGSQIISDGGSATFTHVSNGGLQLVFSGGTAGNTHISSGGLQIASSGGTAMGTLVSNGGSQVVSDGGWATGTYLNYDFYEGAEDPNYSGYQYIHSGGLATWTHLRIGASAFIYDGGEARNTFISSGGIQFVSGGSTESTTISGGRQDVSSGGVATSTLLEDGGQQYVYDDGLAEGTTINGGGLQFVEGGSAVDTIINSDGRQEVSSGGVATDTTIENGGRQYVYTDGLAADTTINSGGSQLVSDGGRAASTTVLDGGRLSAYVGGTVEDVMISSGGSVNMEAGTFMDGPVNMLREGGILTGPVELLIDANLTIERITDGTQSNAFTGAGGLTKIGAGVLTLTGVNTYTGGTTVSEGTLKGDTISVQGDILNNAHVMFDQPFDDAYSGQMSGTGNLTKTGGGWLGMVAENTFSGDLRILNGGIRLGVDGTLTNARSLYLASGTTLDYSAATAHATLGNSPVALKHVTIAGLNTTIVPGQGVGGGANFDNGYMLFLIPPTARNNDIFLTVDGDASLIDVTYDLRQLNSRTGRSLIAIGEKLILVDATGTMDCNVVPHEVQVTNGDKYIMETNVDQLYLTLTETNPTNPEYPRLGAYALTRIAQVAFLDQGYDLLLHQGMKTAQAATAGPGIKIASFGGIGGGWSRYKTGSHVEVFGPQLLLGVAAGTDVFGSNDTDGPIGRATGGVFFESGWGGHNTFENFRDFKSVKGSGDISYYGGGLLGRYDVKQGPLAGLYAEASGRVGWSSLDFHTSDIQYNGWNARFSTSAVYYGAHGGVGYLWNVPGTNDKGTLDASAKLLWTHLAEDNITVYQDRVRFYDADSLRLRLGGRFTYAATETISPYVGAYWEQQFDGTQRMTVNGHRTASPTLRGHTGIGELGVTITPSKNLPISIDLGLQGHAGRRDGGTASVQVRIDF